MEVFFILIVILLIVFVAIKGSKAATVIENQDTPTTKVKEKKVVFIKEDKSSMLKYSVLLVVFSVCIRFIVLPAVPTTFLVKTEFSSSSHDLKIRHDWGYNHLKIDHDWPAYNTIKVENRNK